MILNLCTMLTLVGVTESLMSSSTLHHPRKKRKLSHKRSPIIQNDTKVQIAKVNALINLIENEEDEEIEANALNEIMKILQSEIKKNDRDYLLYLKLSWTFLRMGQYNEGIAYFDGILPQRDHEKFYSVDCMKEFEKNNYANVKKEKDKKRKKIYKKLKKFECNRPRLNRAAIHREKCSQNAILSDIPLKYEAPIRCNLALSLCRICDYEEALRYCYILRDLYKKEFVSSTHQKCMRYDAYIEFIELKVVYRQKYWHQCVDKGENILIHQKVQDAKEMIIKLDNHSLFELFVILSNSYSKIKAVLSIIRTRHRM